MITGDYHMLPLNLKLYAVNWIEKECKSSCDISSNDSMNLCIGLHGRLKLSIEWNTHLFVPINQKNPPKLSACPDEDR